MALEGTVKIPGIGPISKQAAAWTAIGVLLAGGIWLSRRRAAAAKSGTAAAGGSAAAGGAFTDPAGNTCAAPNPSTGFCPGTAEDLAAQQSLTTPYNASQLGAGGLSGYYYGPGGSIAPAPPGPGGFADNAEWAQYVISYLTQTLSANAKATGDAVGLYLDGQEVTEGQRTLIEEAIAIGGKPPQAGPGGYPPSIRLAASHKPPPRGPKTITVPGVTGDRYEPAADKLAAADLRPVAPYRKPGTAYHVTAQNPRAGARAAPETDVHLTLKEGT